MSYNIKDELESVSAALGEQVSRFEGKTVLLTGGAGFLGYYFIKLFDYLNAFKLSQPCRLICIDSFIRGYPEWMKQYVSEENIHIAKGDISSLDLSNFGPVNFIIHAASIASPTFYRRYPIETIDANVGGLKQILEYCRNRKAPGDSIESVLYFSSSEIYGDPDSANIPTPEDYNGNVSCTGPRACYDESKRLGETLCVSYHRAHCVPVKIVRPFNNYGPGLRLDDRRVIPDFCKNILANENIVLLSDGRATRTFCYISDAITGYLLALLSDFNGEAFNIGSEAPEISMESLALLLVDVAVEELGITRLDVIKKRSSEKEYLIDNPQRRCPSIAKAREYLGYDPIIDLRRGLGRSLRWYREHELPENKLGRCEEGIC